MSMDWILRRPLRLFAVLVAIGVVAIGLAMKSFGGTPAAAPYTATPLSPAQFAQLGENACVSLRRQLKAATERKPRTLTGAARSVSRITSLVDGLNMQLDARVPPPSEVASFRRFLGKIQGAERALHRLDRMTATGQWQSATALVRSGWWHDSVKQLGPSTGLARARCSGGETLTAARRMVANGTSAAAYYFAKPLSRAQFVQALERTCESFRGRFEDLLAQKPTTPSEAAGLITSLTVLIDSDVKALRGLTPPSSVAASYRHMLNTLQTADRAVQSLNQLVRLGQWRRAARLVHSRWWQNIGKRLGPPVAPADIRC
jgi:hypothetical protein